MTATLPSMTSLIITSTTGPTASPATVPSSTSTLPSMGSQETPVPYYQIHGQGPMEEQAPLCQF